MKYIITRTSLGLFSDEKPIDNVVQEPIHYFDDRAGSIVNHPLVWEHFNNKCRDIIKLPNGDYRGIAKNAITVWVAEINNLGDFVKEYGKIILDECDNEEGYMSVEIYDGYRE